MEFRTLKSEVYSIMNDKLREMLAEDEVSDWLNLAMMRICTKFRLLWDYQLVDTDGTALFDLNANLTSFLAPHQVFWGNDEIHYTPWEKLSSRDNQWPKRTGKPERFTMQGQYLRLYPYSSTAYSGASAKLGIFYIKQPAMMTAENSVPFDGITRFVPFHELVSSAAAVKAAMVINDHAKARVLKAEYLELESDVIDLHLRPDEGHEAGSYYEGDYPY